MPAAAERLASRHPLRAALLADLREFLSARLDRLDWSDAQRAGRAIGTAAWRLAKRDRQRTLEHLSMAFPEATSEARRGLGRRSFAHFGTMLGECLWLAARDPEELARRLRIEGWHELAAARESGRPILLITGHCGNWELLPAGYNLRGLAVAVVARELDEPDQQHALLDLRAHFGTRTIVRGTPGAARELLRTLRGGGALGMLIDQDTSVDGVWVDFFGRPAWTPSGAAEIALRFGAAVLPTFVERLADGTHLARIHPPLELSHDPREATQTMTGAIEAQIRKVPEQWVWMHRRWRRQPPGAAPGRPPAAPATAQPMNS